MMSTRSLWSFASLRNYAMNDNRLESTRGNADAEECITKDSSIYSSAANGLGSQLDDPECSEASGAEASRETVAVLADLVVDRGNLPFTAGAVRDLLSATGRIFDRGI